MKQEDKDLLLKDLCARLPYGVMCQVDDGAAGLNDGKLVEINISRELVRFDADYYWDAWIDDVKPYLFPLSSMTEEQKKEYNRWKHEVPVCHYEYGDVVEEVELYDSPESFEYLIENHFDYRGLIERGLAIDCTGLNIY